MFSIIIPIHNKLPHLERSINSVLNQSYKNFELLLIDDASTDGSAEKLLEFKDSRIRRFRRKVPGPGGYAARNLGIKEANYEWIAFLDADDEWNACYLEENLIAIQKHKDLEVISSKWSSSVNMKMRSAKGFDKFNDTYTKFTLVDYFNFNQIMWTSAVAIKKSLLLKANLFPIGKCRRSGDMDTWIRCLEISNKNIFINKPLAIYYRDTINRVTDFKHNPALDFCPLQTIEKIRSDTKSNEMLTAIDNYCAKHVFFRMIDEYKANRTIKESEKLLYIIKSPLKKMVLLVKISLYKKMILLKLR